MKSILRSLVAGPKRKTPYNGGELDLTYITDRIIAMAYPASNFLEKAYRNSITDVANYFNQYHESNYLIINVSSRPYDYSKFNNQVLEYQWPDHQAPPLTTLFEIANKAYTYLVNHSEGVVAVHCNHGKGRTGTAIITILLYLGIFKNAHEALVFYNGRRFSSNTYGVDQPCQTRYLRYVQNILEMGKIPEKLISFRLSNVSYTGLHQKHFLTINRVRNNQVLVEKIHFSTLKQIQQSTPIIGDFFIQVFEDCWPSSRQIVRINYNTFFLQPDLEVTAYSLEKDTIKIVFRSQEIACKKSAEQKNFSLTLEFQYFCFCHTQNAQKQKCSCQRFRQIEQKCWKTMIEAKETAQLISKKHRAKFLSMPLQPLEKQLELQHQNKEYQNVYHLGVHMSNLHQQSKIIGKIRQSQLLEDQKAYIMEQQCQTKHLGVQTLTYFRNKVNRSEISSSTH